MVNDKGTAVFTWNFSREYADLWKSDEEKVMYAMANKDYRLVASMLLISATRYPSWLLGDFNPAAFYQSMIKLLSEYDQNKNSRLPGYERVLLEMESRIVLAIGSARRILSDRIDEKNLGILKTNVVDEEDLSNLEDRYERIR